MNCDEALVLLSPLLDTELPCEDAKTVADHVRQCISCSAELDALAAMRKTLSSYGRYTAPIALKQRIGQQLDIETAPQPTTQNRRWWRPLVSHSAAALLGAILVSFVSSVSWLPVPLDEALFTLHIQSLADSDLIEPRYKDSLVQIRSSDQHTVKPWFVGKVNFSPVVKNLEPEGFRLIGGRVDELDDRKVAVLVYLRRKHIINMFVDTNEARQQGELKASKEYGYNMAVTEKYGFIYWAVADIPLDELRDFLTHITAAP